MTEAGSPAAGGGETAAAPEHLNIKVTDNNNEVFFKIKRSTQLKKLMDAFCDRQGKQLSTVRFLFDGTRVRPDDTPETVCPLFMLFVPWGADIALSSWIWQMVIHSRFIRNRLVVKFAWWVFDE